VSAVIQLNHPDNAQIRRITKDKVNVFSGDAIERRLPAATTRISDWLDNVCQSDLGKNLVVGCQRLPKHSEKRPLCRRKQSRQSLVRSLNTLCAGSSAQSPKQDRADREQSQQHENDNNWRDYIPHGLPK
jgi:hypothetical protein